ncbi:MAG: hypothetical protein M3Q36_01310 [bacterium]|nr:hypothetical protein [bacterium]
MKTVSGSVTIEAPINRDTYEQVQEFAEPNLEALANTGTLKQVQEFTDFSEPKPEAQSYSLEQIMKVCPFLGSMSIERAASYVESMPVGMLEQFTEEKTRAAKKHEEHSYLSEFGSQPRQKTEPLIKPRSETANNSSVHQPEIELPESPQEFVPETTKPFRLELVDTPIDPKITNEVGNLNAQVNEQYHDEFQKSTDVPEKLDIKVVTNPTMADIKATAKQAMYVEESSSLITSYHKLDKAETEPPAIITTPDKQATILQKSVLALESDTLYQATVSAELFVDNLAQDYTQYEPVKEQLGEFAETPTTDTPSLNPTAKAPEKTDLESSKIPVDVNIETFEVFATTEQNPLNQENTIQIIEPKFVDENLTDLEPPEIDIAVFTNELQDIFNDQADSAEQHSAIFTEHTSGLSVTRSSSITELFTHNIDSQQTRLGSNEQGEDLVSDAIFRLKEMATISADQEEAPKLNEQVINDLITALIHLGYEEPRKLLIAYARSHSVQELFAEIEQQLPEILKLIDYQQHLLFVLSKAISRSDRHNNAAGKLLGLLIPHNEQVSAMAA